jgi:hypothetical protein
MTEEQAIEQHLRHADGPYTIQRQTYYASAPSALRSPANQADYFKPISTQAGLPANTNFDYKELPYWNAQPVIELGNEWWLFDKGETHLDIGYVAFTSREEDDQYDGFAVGAHHFFSRFWAIGADYMGAANADLHIFTADLRARIPFDEASFAINFLFGGGGIMGGGGEDAATLELGVGLEVRLLDQVSLTADFRVLEPTKDRGSFYAMRAGISIVF